MAGLEAQSENTEKAALKPTSDSLSKDSLDLMKGGADLQTALPASPADKTLPDLTIMDNNAGVSGARSGGDENSKYMPWPKGHEPLGPDLGQIPGLLPKDGDGTTLPDGKHLGPGPAVPFDRDKPLPPEVIDGLGGMRDGKEGDIVKLPPGWKRDHLGPGPAVPFDRDKPLPPEVIDGIEGLRGGQEGDIGKLPPGWNRDHILGPDSKVAFGRAGLDGNPLPPDIIDGIDWGGLRPIPKGLLNDHGPAAPLPDHISPKDLPQFEPDSFQYMPQTGPDGTGIRLPGFPGDHGPMPPGRPDSKPAPESIVPGPIDLHGPDSKFN